MEPNYKCSMEELYTGATMLKNSLLEYLVKFTEHKPKYDASYVTAFGDAINAADAIPDETQRNADNEAKRYLLMRKMKAAPEALEPAEGELKLGKLRNYIEGAYADKGYRKIMLKDAGFGDYDKAMKFNWETLREVFNKGKEFIADKLAELTANNNMPAIFGAEFETFAGEVIAEVDSYLNVREDIKLVTQSKIVANNAIYETVREICSDGQTLYSRNPAIRAQFTWNTIMEIVTPPGAAGLRGSVKEMGTNTPLAGVLIWMQKEDDEAVTFSTGADGKYFSGNLPVGQYVMKLTKPGYSEINTTVEIKTGTISYKHWKLNVGSGTVSEAEGALGAGMMGFADVDGLFNDDADVVLEVTGTTMNFFASDIAGGGSAVGGIIGVNMGAPVEMKASVLRATLGMDAANPYLNMQETAGLGGNWKVRVSW